MTTPTLEVADIVRAYGPAYVEAFGDQLSSAQRRALRDLARCRTAELGGHVEACDRCGHRRIAYNSCRNRHCPKCQAVARAGWLDERAAELLPVDYFHVVVTLPDELGPLALQNPRVVYGTLFRASAETLLTIAADPAHLGAEIGFLSVLHTWGQNLHLHPHVHVVVPGGGLAPGGDRWVACRPGFFLPVKVLSRVFRGKFLAQLEEAFRQGRLSCHGRLQPLAEATAFFGLTAALREKEWVVYAKPPFGGPEQVLKYLARYTHRVALSNRRLVKIVDDQVHFTWKDYADGHTDKVMALPAFEFLRRFLQHVVPSGFVRIRHYGLLANRHREEKLQRCRHLLRVATPAATEAPASASKPDVPETPEAVPSWALCPSCGQGRMIWVEDVPRPHPAVPPSGTPEMRREAPVCDSS
jgi:Putative transposase/Transposase zinc-binding domain